MSHRKDLAAALLEEHAVRPEALERARRDQQRTGRPLWAVLLDGGLCSEDAVFLALRRWSGAPALSEERLGGLRVPAELREAVPPELASAEGVLPLERSADGRRVALAMIDPLSEATQVRAALARQGVVEIHRFLLHRGVLRRCLGRLYGQPSRPPPGAEPGTPAYGQVPLSDQPTGIVRLPDTPPDRSRAAPRRRTRGDETERLSGRPGRPGRSSVPPLAEPTDAGPDATPTPAPRSSGRAPLLSPPLQRPPAITQPLPPIGGERQSTVQIDPDLMAEIVRFESGDTPRNEDATPRPAPRTGPDGAAARPGQGSWPPQPAAAASAVSPLPPARAAAPTGPMRIVALPQSAEATLVTAPTDGKDDPLLAPAHAFAREVARSALAGLARLAGPARPPGPAGPPSPRGAAEFGALADRVAAALSDALHDEAGPEIAQAVLLALRAQPPAPIEITPIVAPDPDTTREVALPGAAEGATPFEDSPSDPEFEIELGEVSDAGLEAYDYEEK